MKQDALTIRDRVPVGNSTEEDSVHQCEWSWHDKDSECGEEAVTSVRNTSFFVSAPKGLTYVTLCKAHKAMHNKQAARFRKKRKTTAESEER